MFQVVSELLTLRTRTQGEEQKNGISSTQEWSNAFDPFHDYIPPPLFSGQTAWNESRAIFPFFSGGKGYLQSGFFKNRPFGVSLPLSTLLLR